MAEILVQRTVRRLTDPTGLVLAEVADDRVTARRLLPMDGSGDAALASLQWREIEVELVGAAAELLDDVDARLRAEGLRPAGATSTLAHLLGTSAPGGPQRKPSPKKGEKVTAKTAAGQVLLDHLGEQVAQVRSQDLPVRLDAPTRSTRCGSRPAGCAVP